VDIGSELVFVAAKLQLADRIAEGVLAGNWPAHRTNRGAGRVLRTGPSRNLRPATTADSV
jgi:hypothetical protein